MRLFRLVLAVPGVMLVFACSPSPQTAAQPAGSPASGAATSAPPGIVENLTGKAAVDAGRRAEDRIRQISEERNRDLDQVMGK